MALQNPFVTVEMPLNGSDCVVGRTAFVATAGHYQVLGLTERHSVLGSTTLMLVKAVGSTPIASGTPLLSSTVDLASAVEVPNEATLINSTDLQTLAPGDAIALRWGATNLGAIGSVQIRLMRV